MADIHPNDIGLATYADVGNVDRLKTAAKNIVDAINEVYQNCDSDTADTIHQLYVEGENNVILGKGNVVYGNNNLVIGNDNIIVGDNINLIGNAKSVYTVPNQYFSITDIEAPDTIHFDNYDYSAKEYVPVPFVTGDKVIITFNLSWADDTWTDWISYKTAPQVCEIQEIGTNYVIVSGLNMDFEPPDSEHTNFEDPYCSDFIVLNSDYSYIGSKSSIILGSNAEGTNSVTFNNGSVKSGNSAFAANHGIVSGDDSSAFGKSTVTAKTAFSANEAKNEGVASAAFNHAYVSAPYSFGLGYYSRAFGRILRCRSLNKDQKTITLDSGQRTDNLVGKKIYIRYYNRANSCAFLEATIESVYGDILTLTGVEFPADMQHPDSYAFVENTTTIYGFSNTAGGSMSAAANRNSLAYGERVLSVAEGAVTFGKNGNNTYDYSIALANGSSLQNKGIAFLVQSTGDVSADGAYTSPCADYAEFFEWADQNPDNEDRTGYLVRLQGDKIVKCDDFDVPLGVISVTPAIVGDSSELHWQGKFVTDDFGRVQYHDVVIPQEVDENGNVVVEEHIETQPVLNPDWSPDTEYIPRKDRKEWATVGVLGKLVVYDDGTLNPGDICRCGNGGIAVKSIENGYPVLKRVADDKVLIWFRG